MPIVRRQMGGGDGLPAQVLFHSAAFTAETSAYLYRGNLPAADGSDKQWVNVSWVRQADLTEEVFLTSWDNSRGWVRIRADTHQIQILDRNSTTTILDVTSAPVTFVDPTAFMQVYVAVDTTLATASDRVQLWVNGERIALTGTFYDQNQSPRLCLGGSNLNINRRADAAPRDHGSWLAAQYILVTGEYPLPTEFGQFDSVGRWMPVDVSDRTWNASSIYYDFADPANVGKDQSGNGLSATNYGTVTTRRDTPDDTFPIFVPFSQHGQTWDAHGAGMVPINRNVGSFAYTTLAHTLLPTSGRWYVQGYASTITGNPAIGIASAHDRSYSNANSNRLPNVFLASDGRVFDQVGGNVIGDVGVTFGPSERLGVGIDMENLSIHFFKDLIEVGTPIDGTLHGLTRARRARFGVVGYNSQHITIDAGQGGGDPPAGYSWPNSRALPSAPIRHPQDYFETRIRSGNSASNPQSLQQGGSAGLSMTKRTNSIDEWQWIDSARGAGTGTGLRLFPNEALAEQQYPAGSEYLVADPGRTIEGALNSLNETGGTYLDIHARLAVACGISATLYTGNGSAGRRVAHGLDAAEFTPGDGVVIVKRRTGDDSSWVVGHAYMHPSAPWNYWLRLDQDGNRMADAAIWNNTAPDGQAVTLGDDTRVNGPGEDYVMICIVPVPGFSAVFTWDGNDDAVEGEFKAFDFTPEHVVAKRAGRSPDQPASWREWSRARNAGNPRTRYQHFDLPNAEYTSGSDCEFFGTGFAPRETSGGINDEASTFIGWAFAALPSVQIQRAKG